ncbi:type III secretion system chaperone [Thalassomonas viridans]|uniref:Type III secretion system chaperone n=1 Tax=Thalassomonas viridans TaxID=137584 RepID=A0AAF0C6M3_9GAMM|nr:type III secretion system chaperone [Thalassomonas viridans]WDE02803.1 type III secretion system chaperone [Thalassomonas viridans]
MILENFVNTLCEKYKFAYFNSQIPDLGQDAFTLICDDLNLRYFEASGKFHLIAKIVDLPADEYEQSEALQRYLKMALTYLKRYPVSLVAEGQELIAFYQLPVRNVDYSQFESVVEEFLNAVAFFKQTESDEVEVSRPVMMLHP